MKKIVFLLCLWAAGAFAQRMPVGSHEIVHELQKFQVVGTALYVAAHPDDENTLFITYLSNEKKVRTGYIALTRGDGGQNLIGAEQGENVGLLRTHELLEARKRDGGEQFFSRAVDFGFTKTTEEALLTWGKDKVLHDLVWTIRSLQPDVMVNRFPPDSRAGHGHHSASAVLSAEAFDAAGDPTRFPEQLKYVQTWKPKRLVWNSYSPGFQNDQPTENAFIEVPLGGFNPILGKSYGEIAAEARSQHRSQGFGSAMVRDQRTDYALHIKGERAVKDLFDGVDISWNRIPGGASIGQKVEEVIRQYNYLNPAASVPGLLAIKQDLDRVSSPMKIVEYKKKQLDLIILACGGVWTEALSSHPYVAEGEKVKVFVQLNPRSVNSMRLTRIRIPELKIDSVLNQDLPINRMTEYAFDVSIPKDFPISQPYWLQKEKEKGFYQVDNPEQIGQPMAPPALHALVEFQMGTQPFSLTLPVKNKYVEPSRGEIYRYFEIQPPVTVTFRQKVLTFDQVKPKNVSVVVRAAKDHLKSQISLDVPTGWKVTPSQQEVVISKKGEEKIITFSLLPSTKSNEEVRIKAVAKVENQAYSLGYHTISYEHIPELHTFPPAEARAIKMSIQKTGTKIGYIAGAGDEVPAALEQIGYEVSLLKEANFTQSLAEYDAIVVGVRAYNTEDWLPNYVDKLMEYVKNGGNVVTQYQTRAFYGMPKAQQLGPFPFEIGRGRVTDEEAEVQLLYPQHPLLQFPNKITSADFKGWVQERGLYFAEKWSPDYQTIFSMKDGQETAQEGALLYAPYGKGNYIFTGMAFFRQLPAGVPGAYRLFANLLSVPKRK